MHIAQFHTLSFEPSQALLQGLDSEMQEAANEFVHNYCKCNCQSQEKEVDKESNICRDNI